VLLDDLGLRGAIAAFWLRQLGYDVAVARLDDGLRALQPQGKEVSLPPVQSISAVEVLQRGGVLVDLRDSAAFRKEHIAAARWGIRPRLGRLGLDPGETVYLIGDTETAALATKELGCLGLKSVFVVQGGHAALAAAGAPVEVDDSVPSAEDAIDFLFFVHDRHDGNLESSRRYLAWEQGLIAQLDAAERSAFRLSERGV